MLGQNGEIKSRLRAIYWGAISDRRIGRECERENCGETASHTGHEEEAVCRHGRDHERAKINTIETCKVSSSSDNIAGLVNAEIRV